MSDKYGADLLALEEAVLTDEREELIVKAVRDMLPHARWMAKINSSSGHWMLNVDDLLSEGVVAVVMASNAYLDHVLDGSRSWDWFRAHCYVAIRNRIKSAVYTATLTHRQAELLALSLDDEGLGIQIPGGLRPDVVVESLDDLSRRINSLEDDFDIRVLNAVLGGNERVAMYIQLSRDRRNFVFQDPTITITPLIVARALCESVQAVRQSYARISDALYSERRDD